jgi:hypothetical protein
MVVDVLVAVSILRNFSRPSPAPTMRCGGHSERHEHADTAHGEFHYVEFHALMASSLVELLHRRLLTLLATITRFK